MNKKSANGQLRRQAQFQLRPVYAAVLLAFATQTAQANPTGASVVSGSAGFATSGNTLTVTNTPGTIINWQGFSIGSNEITRFAQQSASSTVLNRVVGSDPSNILGKLQSNGRVFLINPNGILFGAGAVVDVAGLVASTLNLSNADFLAGNYHFTEVPGAANISNAGNITAQDNGQIYLIAPNVENTGVITAPNGEILLAAGYSVDLVSTNDPNLRVNITAPAGDATNVGQLIASSGSLGLFGTVVRNSGIVNADSATMQGGKIVFKASQTAEISGTVSANGATGGSINVLGNQVGIMDGATVTANGAQGGGTVLIGGDAHGANPGVQNAQLTYVAPTATISADATQSGDGGKVVLWSDQATQFGGNITARGGAVSGNGGWVEVSGKQWLDYAGLADTTATHGITGSLLLDPTDITISTATPTTMIWDSVGLTYTDIVNQSSNLNVTTLTGQLKTSNVTVDTTSTLPSAGNITVQNDIAWSSTYSLTLNAAGAINVKANITNTDTSPTGGLSLLTAGGNINIGGNISLTGGTFNVNTTAPTAAISMTGVLSTKTFTLGGGTWKQISATLPGFNVTDFQIAGGTFIRALGGDGVNTPYQLADIYGVQGIGSAGMLGNSYALVKDIDASATKTWNVIPGAGPPVYSGFAPVGNVNGSFSGKFDGQGHTISNLYINLPAGSNVGLFGNTSGESISNVGLVNASVSGMSYVGGLVGYNSYGSISNSYSSGGTISATGNNAGGLVGYSNLSSSIINSYVNGGKVTGISNVGGLVGYSYNGSISGSHVDSVTVTGTGSAIGGLVGYVSSISDGGCRCVNILNSYVNNGTVSGSSSVGGLVGHNAGGDISGSYVSGGTVTATGWNAGGLVGQNLGSMSFTGSISNSHVSATAVSGMNEVGGLVGVNGTTSGVPSNSTITGSYVSGGTITASGNDVGGLVGNNFGGVSSSYASSANVISNANDTSANAGGLVGLNSGIISSSYASSGSVIGNGTGVAHNFGGLVGQNTGSINTSYVSNGSVTGSGTSAYNFGGLVGDNNGGTISNTFASSGSVIASGASASSIGGLVGNNTGSISNSYASNGVVGNSFVGGLVGNNAGTVSASFWNTTAATGVSFGIGFDTTVSGGTNTGATGLDSAGMVTMSNFANAGWDISAGTGTIWRIAEGLTMPLFSYTPGTITVDLVDGIVAITDQREKPKPEELLAAEDTLTEEGGNPLPICN